MAFRRPITALLVNIVRAGFATALSERVCAGIDPDANHLLEGRRGAGHSGLESPGRAGA
jgi:hypothetical protein